MKKSVVSSVFFALLAFAIPVLAGTVPANDFLYPADSELKPLAGIEYGHGPNGTRDLLNRCEAGQAKPNEIIWCDVGAAVKATDIPVEQFDWKVLTAQVVFFGEVHPEQDIKKFLMDHMHDLQRQGVNTFAMEMFNVEQQDLLDRYLRDEATIDEVKKAIESVWYYESSGYLKVIEAAKAEGFRILALDDRAHIHGPDFFGEIHARDRHMAEIISGAIAKDPSTKIAVLCGQMHAYGIYSKQDLTRSLPALLRKEHQITTQSALAYGTLMDNGLRIVQQVIHGGLASSITSLPPTFEYGDFILFLR